MATATVLTRADTAAYLRVVRHIHLLDLDGHDGQVANPVRRRPVALLRHLRPHDDQQRRRAAVALPHLDPQ